MFLICIANPFFTYANQKNCALEITIEAIPTRKIASQEYKQLSDYSLKVSLKTN